MDSDVNVPHRETIVALCQYEIVRRIFSSLPMKDVKRFASVCKIWNEVASKTRKEVSRLKPVIFCWKAPIRPSGFHKNFEIPLSPDHIDFRAQFSKFMSELWIDPEACLVMSTGEPEDYHNEDSIVSEDGRIITLSGFHLDPFDLDRLLPKHCTTMSLALSGVVLSLDDGEVCELENLMSPPEFKIGVSIALLPRSPKTKMIPFQVSESKSVLLSDIENVKDSHPELSSSQVLDKLLNKTCGLRLDPDDKIQCLLAFTNTHEYPYITRLIKTIGSRSKRQVAVGGAVGNLARCSSERESLYSCLEEYSDYDRTGCEDYLKTVGFIIAGDGVQAASVVIGRTIKTEEKFEQELAKLKSCGLPEERSIAFMFACCARGSYFYHNRPDVECKVFRKLFPKVPLVGAFCGGEIGVTYLPNVPPDGDEVADSSSKRKKPNADKNPPTFKDKEIVHSFTSVFVLLTF